MGIPWSALKAVKKKTVVFVASGCLLVGITSTGVPLLLGGSIGGVSLADMAAAIEYQTGNSPIVDSSSRSMAENTSPVFTPDAKASPVASPPVEAGEPDAPEKQGAAPVAPVPAKPGSGQAAGPGQAQGSAPTPIPAPAPAPVVPPVPAPAPAAYTDTADALARANAWRVRNGYPEFTTCPATYYGWVEVTTTSMGGAALATHGLPGKAVAAAQSNGMVRITTYICSDF